MSYFFLEEKAFDDATPLAAVGKAPHIDGVNWYAGARFSRAIPQPFRCELDPDVPGELPWLFKGPVPLMHEKMIEALRDAGVDNLDCYDALIVDPEDGSEWTEYKAVNVIGQISAVDLGKSRFDPEQPHRLIAMSFDAVEIDPSRVRGPLLFRLAESVTGIVVHETVRSRLTERGIEPLGYIEPEDWIS